MTTETIKVGGLTITIPTGTDEELLGGYTRDELKAAFDAVLADPRDWKAAIMAVVPKTKLAVTVYAIEFFTATTARVSHYSETASLVSSIGYQAGPAGDH